MRSSYLLILLAAGVTGVIAAGSEGVDGAGLTTDAQIVPRVRPAAVAANLLVPRPTIIREDTNLVLVPVTVTDPLNRFVTGLSKDNFEIYEDKVEQRIVSFGYDDAPLSLGIVFDTNGSMGPKLERSRLAVADFFQTANPEDEAFLVEFSDHPHLSVPFTHNMDEIQNKLIATKPKGRTALYDSIYLALNILKTGHNPRKALLLITDGGDNGSRYTQAEIKGLLEEADVQLYAIGIYENLKTRKRTPEEFAGPGILTNLTEPTGGRHFIVENLEGLPDIAAKIGIELHNQYVIGYSPGNSERDGKYRRIAVKLVRPSGFPPLSAYWRTGYIAPTQ